MKKALSHKFIDKKKHDPSSPSQDYYDTTGNPPGFFIRIGKKTKTFYVKYNPKGRTSKKSNKAKIIGRYYSGEGGWTLAEARIEARNFLADIERGIDPQAAKGKIAITFGQLAENFFKHSKTIGHRTAEEKEGRIKLHLEEWFDRDPFEIRLIDVNDLLEKFVERGQDATYLKVKSDISQIYRVAQGEGLNEEGHNPTNNLLIKMKVEPKERNLSLDEIKLFWEVNESLPNNFNPVLKAYNKLLLVTGQRGGETRIAKWEHLEDGVWLKPKGNVKNKKDHLLPITPLMNSIFQEAKELSGPSQWIFPRKQTTEKPIVNNRFSLIWIIKEAELDWFTNHDLRRTVATRMNKDLSLTYTAHIAKILNHQYRPPLEKAYLSETPEDFLKEKTEALETWNNRLQEILSS